MFLALQSDAQRKFLVLHLVYTFWLANIQDQSNGRSLIMNPQAMNGFAALFNNELKNSTHLNPLTAVSAYLRKAEGPSQNNS